MKRAYFSSPIGILELVSNGKQICELNFVENSGKNDKNDENLKKVLRELELYFSGKLRKFSIDIYINASEFEQKIYNSLLQIPYGKTITYGELAASIGRQKAFRAAGNANAKNKIPIIIPCHRVVSTQGLGGYSGGKGIETKRFLLELEQKFKD
ncbi:methylated-DNA--[protein]-cysteine S-methyltransferase [Campylobacter suis]|uniref:Methylated-DNA--protein-cysteine methyltransferase n=1 Tax=Campylobacter suis TaxID=2790657 RepID=A0ABM8Q8N6_9BACT|nr:methylated-DNA--[protein]-cysteine S-methyltransferase [Campylobacter suis]CAD7289147.1 Methylated-DNA--protein-cysteine methyltransferase [Campylobacter suis]